MKRLLLSVIIILAISHIASAQEPSLFVAGMEMKIGMSQTTILNHLKKNYELREINDSKSLFIYERGRSSNEVGNQVGQVDFDKGKLALAAKVWYHEFAGTADKLVDIIHIVLGQMEQRGETEVTIKTRTKREPNFLTQQVDISLGKKRVTIAMIDNKGSKTVLVYEIIRLAPFTE